MKFSRRQDLPGTLPAKVLNPTPDLDLLHRSNPRKPPRRKTRTPKFSAPGTRVSRSGTPAGKRSRPETPLLKWKFDERVKVVTNEKSQTEECDRAGGSRKVKKGSEAAVAVSARKIAAGIWRLQLPEVVGERSGRKKNEDRPGNQRGVGHVAAPFLWHRNSIAYESEGKDQLPSPRSVSGPKNGYMCKVEPTFSNSAMEGATKWDPACSKISEEVSRIYSNGKPPLDQQVSAVSMVSALEAELEQARSRIHDLETERRSSKKKLEHFLRKLSEERASWRSKEHEKVRAVIDDVKAELNRERKNRQRMEIVNSKLVNELADVKLSAKRFMHDYEKERKAREIIEEVCEELAKEIGEDKAEVEALKRESMKLREEVEEERKMLQMAEVWREERVQMKLVDAKVALEEKYSQMNKLVADLGNFLRSMTTTPDVKEMREVESIRQAAASVNIQDIKEFSYEPPKSDDIFSVFDDVNFGEGNEREIVPCVAYSPASHASKIHTVSPEIHSFNKELTNRRNSSSRQHLNAYAGQDGDVEDDGSGWETVSQVEDQGSSYSPDGSAPSVNKRRDSNVSMSGTEWEEEETPITEISEVCSVPPRPSKKSSSASISRLWRTCPNSSESNYKTISVEGINGRLSNGRISNVSAYSPDRGSGKGGYSPQDMVGHWSSPESGNPHITKGMKGCIEWPRGAQKHSLKAKLLEARVESQKVQLRQVLKQKI